MRELRTLATTIPPDVIAGQQPARRPCVVLGRGCVEARIAERAQKWKPGDRAWQRAVALEDGFAYNEPADWFYPMRHYLGAALLDARKPKEAEAVFREDLRRNPGQRLGAPRPLRPRSLPRARKTRPLPRESSSRRRGRRRTSSSPAPPSDAG